MPNPAMMKFFEYAHLPEKLQTVSKPIGEVAKQMEETLADSAEKTAGLRKLLEAKDCFVRAALPVVLVIACLFGCMAPDVSAAEPQRDQYGATIPADGYEVYNRVARDNRPGDLAEAEYRYLRDNMPRGDGLRGLTTRELEAIDPWYRENSDQLAFEQTYGGYTYDQLGSYAGSATKEEHEASVRAHERAEAVQDAKRRADADERKAAAVRQSWKPNQPLPFGDEESAEGIERSKNIPPATVVEFERGADGISRLTERPNGLPGHPVFEEHDQESYDKAILEFDATISKWKAAYEREQRREAKRAAKKTAGGKVTASDSQSPFMTVGLFSNLLGRSRSSSACANGQCGAQSKAPAAVKPMPLPAKPLPSATKPVKPMAPKPPMTNEQKREAFNKAVREGRYGEILVGNDFTPGGSDFDGPVDYIPVAPKPTPKVVK